MDVRFPRTWGKDMYSFACWLGRV